MKNVIINGVDYIIDFTRNSKGYNEEYIIKMESLINSVKCNLQNGFDEVNYFTYEYFVDKSIKKDTSYYISDKECVQGIIRRKDKKNIEEKEIQKINEYLEKTYSHSS